jgi:4-hydroxy-tetrahydrodipicolinate reductase
MPLRILLNGSKGRMGHAITAIASDLGATIAAACDVGDNPAAHVADCDVIIDFSFHSVTLSTLELAVANNKPIVIGTTGHSPEEKKELLALAAKVPCVWAGNFSVGMNLLFALTRRAASVLVSDYDAEVTEMHHRFKKDAPSGTAARLVEIILEERKLSSDALRHGRQGITGERSSTEVGVHSLRGGDVVGDHTVMCALRAAHWIVSQKPGLYDMQDVLGLK